MSRHEAITTLKKLAFGVKLLGRNPFQARAYEGAARAIKHLEGDLGELLASGELEGVKGIGSSTLKIVDDVVAGRTPEPLAKMYEEVPPGVFELASVRGLGPGKVKALWQELGITSLGQLEYACNENRLVDLAGFGPKTQDKVLAAIAESREYSGFVRLDQAAQVAAIIEAEMPVPVVLVGPFARRNEVVDEVAALFVAQAFPALWSEDFTGFEAGYDARAAIIEGARVALYRVDSVEVVGVAELRLTADEVHWQALVRRAEALGLVLAEDGLRQDGERLPCADADAVYAQLGLHPVPVERRDKDPVLVGREQAPVELVRREHLTGAFHNHTVASDGVDTLEAMRRGAQEQGFSWLGISDHSQSAQYARGLEAERLDEQRQQIEALSAEGPVLLRGVESDILADGALDYPDEVLASLDFVVASVHSRHRQNAEEMTARMVAAASNPWTTMIGHPTGRLLLGRPPSDYDMGALLDACAASGCAVELNAHPHRLDLNETHLAMAKERGIPISIAADAHSARALSHIDWGIAIARRAGLRPDDVLNARPLSEVRAWLESRRAASP